jgi:hypothetical protein
MLAGSREKHVALRPLLESLTLSYVRDLLPLSVCLDRLSASRSIHGDVTPAALRELPTDSQLKNYADLRGPIPLVSINLYESIDCSQVQL